MTALKWSTQQQNFLDWCQNGVGSCVLIAVAGAGKTTVAIAGATLLTGQVAIMAFNKKIAEEIKVRLVKAGMDWKKAQGGTAHSFGFSAFNKAFPGGKVDEHKVTRIIDAIVAKAGPYSFEAKYGQVIAKLVGFAKQSAIGVVGSIDDAHGWMELINHYDVWSGEDAPGEDNELVKVAIEVLKASNANTKVIDFDDMIYLPILLKVRFWQFDNIMIDEAQDTNAARRILARVMLKKGGRLIAIGDPAQAINGFAGADNDSLDQIKAEFSCKEMPLTVSFRCPKAVVKFAQQFASHITSAPNAIEGSVSSAMANDILNGKIMVGGEDAILCRNTQPLVTLCMKMIRNKIGAKIEGRDIGLGLKKLAHRWTVVKTLDALRNKLEIHLDTQRTKLLAKKQEARFAALEDQVECLFVIIEACKAEQKNSLTAIDDYLDALFADNVKGVCILSTIHKSKGREWKRVFWLNRLKTCPSKWARQEWEQEQENNLQYVCSTRSQNELIDLIMLRDKEE